MGAGMGERKRLARRRRRLLFPDVCDPVSNRIVTICSCEEATQPERPKGRQRGGRQPARWDLVRREMQRYLCRDGDAECARNYRVRLLALAWSLPWRESTLPV